MQLAKNIENQLQEVLDNRPNEEKEEHRRRQKHKDIIKKAKRGSARSIESTILNKHLQPVIETELSKVDLDDVVVHISDMRTKTRIKYTDKMLGHDEIENLYPDTTVTQTRRNGKIEFVEKEYWWILSTRLISPIYANKTNSVTIKNRHSHLKIDNYDKLTFGELKTLIHEELPKHKAKQIINELERLVLDYSREQIERKVYSHKYDYISEDDLKTLSIIKKYRK